jgi:hypothetical protein
MDEKLQEDWLDARLRDEAVYIDDAGFTAGVVQRLPAPRPRRSFRALILFGVTLLASVITYVVSEGGKFIGAGIDRLTGLPPLWILAVTIVCSLILTSIGTAAAFAKTRAERFG